MKVIKQTALATVLASTLLFTGCGYNTLQVKDEAVMLHGLKYKTSINAVLTLCLILSMW
jgi:hypothetical protein